MNDDESSSGAALCGGCDAFVDAGRRTTFARQLRNAGMQTSAAPRISTLVNAIEGEVVPRLMLSRRRASPEAPPPANVDVTVDPADLDELTRLLLLHDVGLARGFVRRVHERGMPLEAVCLGLLAPAARRLGQMWEEDLCDFASVTVGLWHLHEVLREVGGGGRTEACDGAAPRSVLLAPVPGEQHTFGLLMVAEFFRRSGWSVTTEYPASGAALVDLVAADRYALLGLTVGCREQLEGLSGRITQLRRASRNKSIAVMLGGRVFADHPELAARLGADITAVDARAAAYQADCFVRLMG